MVVYWHILCCKYNFTQNVGMGVWYRKVETRTAESINRKKTSKASSPHTEPQMIPRGSVSESQQTVVPKVEQVRLESLWCLNDQEKSPQSQLQFETVVQVGFYFMGNKLKCRKFDQKMDKIVGTS